MNAFLLGAAVVLTTGLFSALGLLVVNKFVRIPTTESFNNVAGSIFQVTGTLYAVLLGLIVVDAMNSMSEIRVTVEQEANAVANIFILSEGLPSTTSSKVEKLAIGYVDTVIDEEWAAMSRGQASKKAAIATSQLWSAIIGCQPENDSQLDIRSMSLSQMETLGDARRKRLLASMHGVSPILWTVLISGGLTTIIFTYFFGLESLIARLFMAALVGSSVSLNIYLVYLFGYPFSGSYCLPPESFVADRIIFKLRKQGLLNKFEEDEIDLEELRKKQGERG